MKKILTMTLFLFVFGLNSQASAKSTHFLIKETQQEKENFLIVDKNIHDSRIKTQVEQHIMIKGVINDKRVKEILNKQYNQLKNSTGYVYHEHPTNIYLYVYDTVEKAKAGQGLWLGMLMIKSGDDKPDIKIKSDQIKLLSAPKEEKFGLLEKVRKNIYKESWAVETRATDGAMKRYPRDWKKQIDVERQLKNQYKKELAKKYNITLDQLSGIEVEGLERQWPH